MSKYQLLYEDPRTGWSIGAEWQGRLVNAKGENGWTTSIRSKRIKITNERISR